MAEYKARFLNNLKVARSFSVFKIPNPSFSARIQFFIDKFRSDHSFSLGTSKITRSSEQIIAKSTVSLYQCPSQDIDEWRLRE